MGSHAKLSYSPVPVSDQDYCFLIESAQMFIHFYEAYEFFEKRISFLQKGGISKYNIIMINNSIFWPFMNK